MAYNPVDPRDQIYYQNPGSYIQSQGGYELRSVAPSFTSYKGSFISQNTIPNDAASDHQHLLQGPNQPSQQGAPWKPGFWRRFPVLAILSILGVLASTLASIAILVTSHRKPLFFWGKGIAPSVFLAIASVIANALTAYALACGLEITFWRNALHGRTLGEINQNWLNGHSLYHALVQGYRRGGRVTSLACILAVLALLRGPLFQRASAVDSEFTSDTSGTTQLAIAQKFPPGYTGIAVETRASTRAIARLTPVFADVMQDYSLRRNISLSYEGCGNNCEAVVKAFGFNTTCWTTEYTQAVPIIPVPDQEIFVSSTSLYPIGEKAQIATYYEDVGMQFNVTCRTSHNYGDVIDNGKKVQGMITNLKSHICNLTGGLVEYKVRLSQQTVSLASNRSEDRFLETQVMRGPGSGFGSTIGGFQYAASYLFSSSAVFQFRGAKAATVLQGSLANEMIRGNLSDSRNEKFDDPMESMLDKMREIAFRTAVRAARDQTLKPNETDAVQQVAYKGSATYSIYVTDFRYMIGAAVLSIASVIATSLCFWGWWQLGRTVSLSPLEIAKAFDAPLLSQVGSNLDLSENKNLGYVAGMRLQYGVRADDQASSTQYAGGQMEHQKRRLVIGQAGYVGKPNAGDHYGN